ncbi:DNA double-strand break repair helicase HerA [Nymphon striatum]|nr:DNA double-strand break repair helicase HerA [Nymphon striatum]
MTSSDLNNAAALVDSNVPTQRASSSNRADVDLMSGENKDVLEKEFSRDRTRGYVIRCDGEHAIISADIEQGSDVKENYWSVGQLISIKVGRNRVVGITCSVEVPDHDWDIAGKNEVHITLELVGEIVAATEEGREDKFSTGIASYPQMGCIAHRIRGSDLAIIYKSEGDTVVKVGQLTQDQTIDAKIEIDMLLSRHFAVVGTTGVGKSTSVTLILRKVIKARPDIRVLMLDPHNEFASAFPDTSVVVDSSNLILPFWLFKLEEFSEVVFRGQKGFDSEIEILRDLIPVAKERYRAEAEKNASTLMKKKSKSNLTADMPVPYRMVDLLKLIDERLGMLEGKADKPILKSLEYRLQSISEDPRFRFMFDQSNGNGGDIMEDIISKIFRVPHNDKPICVLEMSGLPTEVVNSVVSILSRMAFEIAMNSDGGIQTLVVCEEAHRYIPADPNAGNQKDQEIIRGAVSNGAKSTISFLSSIANRECIAFGEAIQTPMRMTFETMRAEDLPGAHIYEQQAKVKEGLTVSLKSVLRRMRMEDRKPASDDPYAGVETPAAAAQTAPQTGAQNPADEINSVLNAALSNPNSSLTPQQTPPMAPAPAAPAPPVRQPAPAPAAAPAASAPKPANKAGSLINSFRGKTKQTARALQRFAGVAIGQFWQCHPKPMLRSMQKRQETLKRR